jgi:hypothetical protein
MTIVSHWVKSATRRGALWRAAGDYVDFTRLVEFGLIQVLAAEFRDGRCQHWLCMKSD